MKRSAILIGELIAALVLHAWCVYEVYAASDDVVTFAKKHRAKLVHRCLVMKHAATNTAASGAPDGPRTFSARGQFIPVTLRLGELRHGGAASSWDLDAAYSVGLFWRWAQTNETRYFGDIGMAFYDTPSFAAGTLYDSGRAAGPGVITIYPVKTAASFASTWSMLAVAGLAFNWLGLTAIRRYRRSRQRCESCGCSTIGAGPICPECGHVR